MPGQVPRKGKADRQLSNQWDSGSLCSCHVWLNLSLQSPAVPRGRLTPVNKTDRQVLASSSECNFFGRPLLGPIPAFLRKLLSQLLPGGGGERPDSRNKASCSLGWRKQESGAREIDSVHLPWASGLRRYIVARLPTTREVCFAAVR